MSFTAAVFFHLFKWVREHFFNAQHTKYFIFIFWAEPLLILGVGRDVYTSIFSHRQFDHWQGTFYSGTHVSGLWLLSQTRYPDIQKSGYQSSPDIECSDIKLSKLHASISVLFYVRIGESCFLMLLCPDTYLETELLL